MIKLIYYVPKAHADSTNQALFAAGAGRIGNYDCCCWMTEGTGQFRPLAGADPFIGDTGQLSREPELKVEMVLEESCQEAVRQALLNAHPYETPAYQFIAFSY